MRILNQTDGYSGIAQYYDLFDNKPNIPFYSIITEGSESIIDIGAGTGRISIPLALEGKCIQAIEPSSDMRTIMEEKITFHGVDDRINILPAFSHNFSLDHLSDFAIMSGVYGHLITQKDRENTFDTVYNHLRRDGKFVFDVHLGLMKSRSKRLLDEITVDELTYQRFIQSEKVDRLITSILTYRVLKNGKVMDEREVTSYTYENTYSEIIEQLANTEFSINYQYGDYQFSPYEDGDELLVISLQK